MAHCCKGFFDPILDEWRGETMLFWSTLRQRTSQDMDVQCSGWLVVQIPACRESWCLGYAGALQCTWLQQCKAVHRHQTIGEAEDAVRASCRQGSLGQTHAFPAQPAPAHRKQNFSLSNRSWNLPSHITTGAAGMIKFAMLGGKRHHRLYCIRKGLVFQKKFYGAKCKLQKCQCCGPFYRQCQQCL